MKSMFIVFTLLFGLSVNGYSQSVSDTGAILISKSLLTQEQKAMAEQASKIQTTSKWVEMGKGVGEAINSGLEAVTIQTAKFADTKVGKFTMFIIAWKVLGSDVKGVIFGLITVFVGLPVLVWSYKKYTPTKRIREEKFDEKGKVTSRSYYENDYFSEPAQLAAMFHAVAAFVLLIAASFAIFG